MDEKEVKSRTITLGELWDIMNDFEIPYNLAAQVAMIEASKPAVQEKVSVFSRITDTLRGIFPWM